MTLVDEAARTDVALRRSWTATHLAVPGIGIALVAATVASDRALPYVLVTLVPVVAVLAARAVTVRQAARARQVADRRGYAGVSIVMVLLTIAGPGLSLLPGPAQLTALAFGWLGWLRRDSVVAGAGAAALLAVSPLDIKGPLSLTFAQPDDPFRVSGLLIVAAFLVGMAIWSARRGKDAGEET